MHSRNTFLAAGRNFITRSTDTKTSISALVRFAAATSGSDMGSLYLLDPADRLLKPYVLINLPASYTQGCEAVPLGAQCCGRAALHKRPWFVPDMWTDPLFVDCRRAAMAAGIRAGFSVPVISATTGNCLGTLASHFYEIHHPDQETVESFQMLAELIAYGLERSPVQALHSLA